MSYPPPIPPNPNHRQSPPRRRPTYGADQYNPDQYDNAPPVPTAPRRRPVNGLPPRPNPSGNSGPRSHQRTDSYGAPPVNGGGGRAYSYEWPPEAQQAASGYAPESKSTLVYPDEFVYEQPPPPPPNRHQSPRQEIYQSPIDDYYGDSYGASSQDINDSMANNRPLPPRPPQSPYPPKLKVSPYEQSSSAAYPNERFHSYQHEYGEDLQDPFLDQYHDPSPDKPIRRSSTQNTVNHLDMPIPPQELSQIDVLHPLPPTPKSPPYMYGSPSSEARPGLNRHSSGARPGTRSSTSSMYSYDRPMEEEYQDYNENDYASSPTSVRSSSFSLGRTGTILPVQNRPSYGALRVDIDDLDARPVPPPPPPPHVQLTAPTPARQLTLSSSYSGSSPPIYRSRTEPGHQRTVSTDAFAPPTPPKIPLTEGNRQTSLGILRSQSHSAGVKPLPRSPSHPATLEKDTSATLRPPGDIPLSPITDSGAFPLSSKTFQQCTAPWSLSALRTWIQDVFGSSVSMETISLALQGLFTHHVSTLSVMQADKLAAQVGTTWLREGVLFEPTVANTAYWNPLSILEMGFTPYTVEGVLPTLTGKGCYSTTCSTAPPGLGRCYSHHCSRTLVKKSGLPPPTLPASQGKSSDWKSFWNLDDEFLKTCQKNEIKRQNVIFEFVQSEEEYVTDLNTMLNLFQKQIFSSTSSQLPIIPRGRMDNFVKVVFGNVKPILDWQVKKLLTPLRERQAQQGPLVKGLGDIVLEWVRGCRLIYADYAGGYPFADNLVREETAANSAFASWLEKCQADPITRRLPFNHFLQAPNRKIQRVLLLFDGIIKNTEETNRDRETLQRATDELKEIVHECDARIAETTANLDRQELDEKLVFKTGAKVDLGLKDPTRKVIHQGEVSRKSDNKLEWLDIHLILLDNFLIMTKKRRDRNGEKYFVSKQAIPVDLLVLEGVTGDAVSKPTVGKLVGTMTTTVSAPTPLQRIKSTKTLSKVNSGTSASASPDMTLVTSLTAPQSDKALIYPFSITHLSSSGDTYTLYAESAGARQQWVDRIMEAKNERAATTATTEPFQANIVAESVFANPMSFEQLQVIPPALVEFSTMHRALTALRAEPFGSRTLGRALTLSRINCAKAFIAPDNTDYAHQRLVAVGTDDGVYIGHTPEQSGLCTQWTKVLSLKESTQIDVLEEFGVFLVLANKELIAYGLNSVIPQLPATAGATQPPPIAKQPQRLSGGSSVGFFATGKLKDRMLVLYKRKSGVNAVFKVMEPVVGKADANRRNLFSRKKAQTEFFRDYDDFFIATDCFGLFTFKNTIAIPTQKGFEVLSLDSKDAPSTIPDLSAPHMAHLARRLDGTRALGMFRISEHEFLLCYDECAIYVDKHGEVSRSKVINWHGKPRSAQVIDGKYVLAFDTSFIEIWRCDGEFGDGGVSLVQVIPGRDIRMIGKEEKKADLGLGPGTGYFDRVYVAMGHPERGDRQIVVELVARRFGL